MTSKKLVKNIVEFQNYELNKAKQPNIIFIESFICGKYNVLIKSDNINISITSDNKEVAYSHVLRIMMYKIFNK